MDTLGRGQRFLRRPPSPLGHPGPDDRFDDLHREEYNDTKTQDHLKVRKRGFIDFKAIADRWDLNQDDRQNNLR